MDIFGQAMSSKHTVLQTLSFLRNSKLPRKPQVSKVQVNGELDLFKILYCMKFTSLRV